MRRVATAAAIVIVAAASIVGGAIAFRTPEIEANSTATHHVEALAPIVERADLDATIENIQKKLRSGARDPAAYASLGLAYLQKGRITADPSWFPKAERAFETSLDIEPDENPDAFLGQGLLANARHDFAAGARWARRAVRVAPYNSDGYGVLSDALVEIGDYARADRVLQKMVDLRPGLASFARISYVRELRGDVTGAISAMKQAGDAAGETGPDASWVSSHIGDLYYGSGRIRTASTYYRRARAMDPDGFLPLVGIARVAEAHGHKQRAVGLMRRVTRIYPTPAYLALLSELLDSAGDRSGARRANDTVIAEDRLFRAGGVLPDVEITLFYADHGIDTRNNLATAKARYASRPSVRVADALAWALYSDGRAGEALRYSREALRLGTKDALFYFHSGMIAKAVGYRTAAARYLRTALTLNPHFSVAFAPRARVALSRLEP